MEKPSTHAYSPLQRHGCIFTVYFLKKKKETSNPKVKILCLEGQINIYIVAQKT
jgi:hypothetical protein